MSPASKLPRATLAQKIQVLDFYHSSKRPQSETVDKFKDEFSISTSSLSEWLKIEKELRSRMNSDGAPFLKNSKRRARFKYERINQAMDLLVKRRLERNEPITEPILREHWAIYAHQYGVDNPKRLNNFSHGWLSQFKKRHGLSKKRLGRGPSKGENTTGSSLNTASTSAAEVGEPEEVNDTSFPALSTSEDAENYDPQFMGIPESETGNDGTNKDQHSPSVVVEEARISSEPTRERSRSRSNKRTSNYSNNNSNIDQVTYDLMSAAPRATTDSNNSAPRNQFQPQEGLSFTNTAASVGLSGFGMYNDGKNQVMHSTHQKQKHSQHHQQHSSSSRVSSSTESEYLSHNQAHLLQQQQLKKQAQQMQLQQQQQQKQQQQQQQQQHRDQQYSDGNLEYQQKIYEKQRQQYEQARGTPSSTTSTSHRTGIQTYDGVNSNSRASPSQQQHSNSSTPRPESISDLNRAINASDIERFIYVFADRFFHVHQYEYPQTVKIFQDFKDSFFNERIINMRSGQQGSIGQQQSQQQPSQPQQQPSQPPPPQQQQSQALPPTQQHHHPMQSLHSSHHHQQKHTQQHVQQNSRLSPSSQSMLQSPVPMGVAIQNNLQHLQTHSAPLMVPTAMKSSHHRQQKLHRQQAPTLPTPSGSQVSQPEQRISQILNQPAMDDLQLRQDGQLQQQERHQRQQQQQQQQQQQINELFMRSITGQGSMMQTSNQGQNQMNDGILTRVTRSSGKLSGPRGGMNKRWNEER